MRKWYDFPSVVVARIWEFMRKTFTIDWSRVRRKREVDIVIRRRKRFLIRIIKGQRTLGGISPQKAKQELKNIEKMERVYKRGWHQIKPLIRQHYKVRSYTRKGKRVRPHVRSYLRWTPEQKEFIKERIGMRTKDLMNVFNQRFGTARSYSSIATMKSRLR